MVGIYSITNKLNNHRYIGQSVHIETRFIQHLKYLRTHTHFNKHLQSAWDKYGEACFIFEVLEECEKDCLNNQETYWKLYYDPNTYNLGSTGNVGTVSEETKQKVSNTVRNYVATLTPDERKIKYGHKKNIGKSRSKELREQISRKLMGRPSYVRTQETLNKQSMSNIYRRNIFQFTDTGIFLRAWSSITMCLRNNPGLDQAAISKCCGGLQKTTKGYTFRYARDDDLKLLKLGYRPICRLL